MSPGKTDHPPAPGQATYIYVAGSGHSGSTLLAFLLNSHPAIVAIGEVHAPFATADPTRRLCSCGPLKDCPFFAQQRVRFREHGIDFNPLAWALDYRLNRRPWLSRFLFGSLRYTLLERARQSILGASRRYQRRLWELDRLNEIFAQNALAISGKQVFADTSKDPFRIFHLRRIPSFRLKVIHLIRDPRAVVYSHYKRGREDVKRIIRAWCREQKNVKRQLDRLSASDFMLLRYEDLCIDPASTLVKVGEFVGVGGIKTPRDFKHSDHHIMGNAMRKPDKIIGTIRLDESWKAGLPGDSQALVADLGGRVADRYGYSL